MAKPIGRDFRFYLDDGTGKFVPIGPAIKRRRETRARAALLGSSALPYLPAQE